MSNVLIGIIGVMLFIGLALAGAMLLGDDFRTSSATSRASAVMAQLQQLSAAINMYELKTGQTFWVQDPVALVPRFLRTVPVSPMPLAKADPTFGPRPQPNDDIVTEHYAASASSQLPSTYVTTLLGHDGDAAAHAVCQSIADTYSGGVFTASANTPPGAAGCMRYGGPNGSYFAWMRR